MGFETSAVISLIANIPPGTMLYFDKYFSSEQLLDYLLQINASGTESIIKTRLFRNIFFQDDNTIMKNSERDQKISQCQPTLPNVLHGNIG